ncbi:MAG: hypothetical protein U0414_33930 [Polyangiaceae bacterium]
MAIGSLVCPKPVRRPHRAVNLDYAVRDAAVDLFTAGDFEAAVVKVFEHLFSRAPSIPELREGGFQFVQGSSRVTVTLDADLLSVRVPLVTLPDGGTTTAALRYMLTRICGSGQLHQPRLRGDDVHLEFKERLENLHPIKLLEVLRRMPTEADKADDWMSVQFGAKALESEPPEPLAPEELERSLEIWRAHWHQVDELLKEGQRKRSIFFLNEVTSLARYGIRYWLPLTGYLPGRLQESSAVYCDSDVEPFKREAALTKCIKEMRALSREALEQNLGHARYAISPVSEGTPRVISEYLGPGNYMETISRLRSSGKAMDAALALVSTMVYVAGEFSWAPEVGALFEEILGEASERPFGEAAALLSRGAKTLVERFGEDPDRDDEPRAAGEAS